ncbi:MAG: hypothetical protein L3K14_01900 [Thermoplasmata archaeon]|nr:hypothetical protein [Thermoplasmata archaeon]
MAIRIVTGEIEAKDVTTRVALPTRALPRWPPFERVAETIATPRRPFPPHRHSGVEVLAYVIEGSASYELGSDPPRPLVPGSTTLLTAPLPVSHAINPAKGHTVRWFALVSALPAGSNPPARFQSGRTEAKHGSAEGTIVRGLMGPGSTINSAIGMEGLSIEFESPATSFQRVGHSRVAVAYALAGRGLLDNEVLNAGEAALVENAAGIALHGDAGFQVLFVMAPRGAMPDAPTKSGT